MMKQPPRHLHFFHHLHMLKLKVINFFLSIRYPAHKTNLSRHTNHVSFACFACCLWVEHPTSKAIKNIAIKLCFMLYPCLSTLDKSYLTNIASRARMFLLLWLFINTLETSRSSFIQTLLYSDIAPIETSVWSLAR